MNVLIDGKVITFVEAPHWGLLIILYGLAALFFAIGIISFFLKQRRYSYLITGIVCALPFLYAAYRVQGSFLEYRLSLDFASKKFALSNRQSSDTYQASLGDVAVYKSSYSSETYFYFLFRNEAQFHVVVTGKKVIQSVDDFFRQVQFPMLAEQDPLPQWLGKFTAGIIKATMREAPSHSHGFWADSQTNSFRWKTHNENHELVIEGDCFRYKTNIRAGLKLCREHQRKAVFFFPSSSTAVGDDQIVFTHQDVEEGSLGFLKNLGAFGGRKLEIEVKALNLIQKLQLLDGIHQVIAQEP